MAEDVLHLAVGSPLQLQAVGKPESPRYQVRTIGYLPGGSLVVSTPQQNGRLAIVRPGQYFNVRMLRGESVMGFEVQTLQVANAPYPHLHLSYPAEIERIVVRNAKRVSADIGASARNINDGPEGPQRPVELKDLSMTGAKLVAERPLGAVGDSLALNFEIQVAGKAEQLGLLGTIRSMAVRDRERIELGYNHGVQFSTINRYQQVLLHSWVLERTAEAERQVV
jgi:c-di-GMP-binding flagellar brake protein YcgR